MTGEGRAGSSPVPPSGWPSTWSCLSACGWCSDDPPDITGTCTATSPCRCDYHTQARQAYPRKPAEITVTNGHGTFTATPAAVDRAIMRHLPGSVLGLRKVVGEINPGADYSDVHGVAEPLVMIADAEGI